jgi:hypothetical protein
MSPEDRKLLTDLNNRLTRIERNLGGLANDTRQIEVIKNVISGEDLKVKSLNVKNTLTHQGGLVGFFGKTPTAQGGAIANPPAASLDTDVEARTAINEILTIIRSLGIIET